MLGGKACRGETSASSMKLVSLGSFGLSWSAPFATGRGRPWRWLAPTRLLLFPASASALRRVWTRQRRQGGIHQLGDRGLDAPNGRRRPRAGRRAGRAVSAYAKTRSRKPWPSERSTSISISRSATNAIISRKMSGSGPSPQPCKVHRLRATQCLSETSTRLRPADAHLRRVSSRHPRSPTQALLYQTAPRGRRTRKPAKSTARQSVRSILSA